MTSVNALLLSLWSQAVASSLVKQNTIFSLQIMFYISDDDDANEVHVSGFLN